MHTDQFVKSNTGYRADIDGLRAMAVLLVLVFHFRLFDGMGDAGFLGVDVFFVISGYLITGIVIGQLDERRFRFSNFYLHRVRRLAPALQVTLFLTLLSAWFILLPIDFAELARQLIAAQVYVANVYFWQHVNYFGLTADNTVLLHTWSLAVEEQFYLLFPVALWAAHRWARPWLPGVLLLGLLASFSISILMVTIKPAAAFYLLPTRAWELLAGACLAVMPAATPRQRRLNEGLGWVGLLAIVAALISHRPGMAAPPWLALLPVVGASALIRAGAPQATATSSRLLSWGPWVYMGRISYPAYLVHWPIHVIATYVLGHESYNLPLRWTLFVVSLFLAAAVFHCVEQPIRRSRLSSGRFMGAYAALLLVSVMLLLWSYQSRGIPSRFAPSVVAWANQVQDRPPPLEACEFRNRGSLNTSPECHIGASGVQPTWLIYGDSHAWAAHTAFAAWLRQRGEAAVFSFRHACPPVLGVHLLNDKGDCAGLNSAAMNFLAASPQIHSVALVSTWLQAAEGVLAESTGEIPTKARSIELFNRQLGITLDSLAALNKRVLIWDPVPGARNSVPQAMARAAIAGRDAGPALRFTLDEYRHRYAFFEKALAQHADKVWVRFSPAAVLCGSGACEVVQGQRSLYYDNGHISYSSATMWAAELATRVPH